MCDIENKDSLQNFIAVYEMFGIKPCCLMYLFFVVIHLLTQLLTQDDGEELSQMKRIEHRHCTTLTRGVESLLSYTGEIS